MEKFIQANTQELAKDKWLCPLSGKKFKGPDYVRKHLENKHKEKLEEVRQEVRHLPSLRLLQLHAAKPFFANVPNNFFNSRNLMDFRLTTSTITCLIRSAHSYPSIPVTEEAEDPL